MTTRELNMKPSFSSEVMAFPSSETGSLWQKIDALVRDPLPDGKTKKKLKAHHKIYRLRMGNFRILYTFGEDWIRLLTIRRRSETTYTSGMSGVEYEEPTFVPDEEDDAVDEALLNGGAPPEPQRWTFEPEPPKPQVTPLPRPLTTELLQELRVPAEHIAELVCCESEEALMAVQVPERVMNRVLDNLFPKSVEEVLAQPDLVVQDPKDLIRFKEGDLPGFLLRLDAQQERLCDWALSGPTMVRGGPGTGKSTVALYRVRALLERPGATGSERALFTTYTRSLTRMNDQLLDQLLTPEQRERVEVLTVDQLVRRIIVESGEPFSPPPPGYAKNALREALRRWSPPGANRFDQRVRRRRVLKLSEDYLLDEFRWVIEGRQLTTLDAYQEVTRAGRGVGFSASMREGVWSLYEAYRARLTEAGYASWEAQRLKALELVEGGAWSTRYDFVLVDEAQDCSSATLSLLAELGRTAEGIFMAADTRQSIHTRGESLRALHPRLNFVGRTRHLKHNYRSTGEIEQAAFSVLRPEDDAGAPSECVHTGPMPVLVRCEAGKPEASWAARFIREMARHLKLKLGACGVLVPDARLGEAVAEELTARGVAATYYKGRDVDLSAPEVKVVTLHSAKGLEFPMVVVCGLAAGTFPTPDEYGSDEEYAERLSDYRRLLFVAMTRAMRGLMVIYPTGHPNPALDGLDLTRWSVVGESP